MELSEPGAQPQDEPAFSGFTAHAQEDQEFTITSAEFVSIRFTDIANNSTAIRATDVTLGLRRLPAGFNIAVHHSGLEWRTENKISSVNEDAVEWTGPIPMCDSHFPTGADLIVFAVRQPCRLLFVLRVFCEMEAEATPGAISFEPLTAALPL